MKCNMNIETVTGRADVPLDLTDYKAAADQQLSLPQYLNLKYPTRAESGTAFEQMMATSGLFMREDRNYGIKPPSLYSIFNGQAHLSGSAIVAPDGTDRNTPAGRLLFPAVLIEVLESNLRNNNVGYNAEFLKMVAQTNTVASAKYDQVKINLTRPRDTRSAPISQLAPPKVMLSITTSDVSRSIGVNSIGMEISDEALRATTLDMVGLALREQALEEQTLQYEEDFLNVVNGDVDSGEPGIIGSAVTATSLDASIASVAGVLSQKAWVKFLRANWRKRNITHVVCNIDTYLAIQGRTGRPTSSDQSTTDERLNTVPSVSLPGIPGAVSVFVMENFLANTIVGLDASKALRRITYTGAAYQAIEQFVLTRSSVIRVDRAERVESAGYTEAFQVLTLT